MQASLYALSGIPGVLYKMYTYFYISLENQISCMLIKNFVSKFNIEESTSIYFHAMVCCYPCAGVGVPNAVYCLSCSLNRNMSATRTFTIVAAIGKTVLPNLGGTL